MLVRSRSERRARAFERPTVGHPARRVGRHALHGLAQQIVRRLGEPAQRRPGLPHLRPPLASTSGRAHGSCGPKSSSYNARPSRTRTQSRARPRSPSCRPGMPAPTSRAAACTQAASVPSLSATASAASPRSRRAEARRSTARSRSSASRERSARAQPAEAKSAWAGPRHHPRAASSSAGSSLESAASKRHASTASVRSAYPGPSVTSSVAGVRGGRSGSSACRSAPTNVRTAPDGARGRRHPEIVDEGAHRHDAAPRGDQPREHLAMPWPLEIEALAVAVPGHDGSEDAEGDAADRLLIHPAHATGP